jgi:hypothetical protein
MPSAWGGVGTRHSRHARNAYQRPRDWRRRPRFRLRRPFAQIPASREALLIARFGLPSVGRVSSGRPSARGTHLTPSRPSQILVVGQFEI